MKVKRMLAMVLSVSMLMGQGVYAAETVGESESESVVETVGESESESAVETVGESESESVAETVSESAPESAVETAGESESESAAETVGESVPESVDETIAESMMESQAESTLNSPEDVIEFKDEKLLAALLEECDANSDGFITKEELGAATSLRLDSADITDISGLEYAVNVTRLTLVNNKNLADISALSNLTNLELLHIGNTAISDISALSNLTNLKELVVGITSVSDISVIPNLKNLTYLDLGRTPVSDISALAGMTNLTHLELHDTPVSDISALAGMTNLTYLDLGRTAVLDFQVLSSLTGLERLQLYGAWISDIEPLKMLPNLKYVSLSGTQITDEQRMELMEFQDELNLYVGDRIFLGRDLFIPDICLSMEVTLPEGSEKVSYDDSTREVVAVAPGTARIHVKGGAAEKDITVTIQAVETDPAVGMDKHVNVQYIPADISFTAANDDAVILDSDGQLWRLYPETELIQSDVKAYESCWVYNGDERVHYAYFIDKNDALWLNGVKKLDNVQKADFPYALDADNVLHHLYKDETINGVQDWFSDKYGEVFHEDQDQTTYILKQDGTLWGKPQGELTQVDSGVSQLGVYGEYLKTNGKYTTIWDGGSANNVIGLNKKVGGYYDKNGNFHFEGINFGKNDVQAKLAFCDENADTQAYFLTTDGKIYHYNFSADNPELEYVGDDAVSFASTDVSLKLKEDYVYRLRDGTYMKADGTPLEEGKVKEVGNYTLYLTKNSECEVRKNGNLHLTKAEDIWFNAGRYFALRTDGTIWDITSNPKLIFEDAASVSVSGVTLDKDVLTFTSKDQSSTLKAVISPTYAPDQGLIWSSSNTKVAKVNSSGVVTPVSNGTAVITVKTRDGGKTATCKVTVKFPTVATLTNLKAVTGGLSKVKLTWNAVSGAEGYLVYAQKNGKYGYVGMTTKGTTYTDTRALTDDYNFYWVFPYVKDAKGNMYTGGCQSYKYAKGGVCPAVTDLKASSEIGQVRLTWKASAGAEGYLVYGKTATGKYEYKGMTTKGTTYVHKSASKAEYNFYWVFPYHKDASGKMIVGGTPKYVYGKAR
ncbi:leucine-rich repeat domain-containing protein [Frisingicoccus sp.]|uniref:leucine-rich repeat domain-containing protein n=1 Tax=Frisingicoccus sp. TaxID=1918627 RepID=UPI003AB89426